MLEALLSRWQKRDRQALARLLTLVARGQDLAEIRAAVGTSENAPRVVAITGSTGVGKSTLVGRLAEHLRAAGQAVAVLACDPQSPLTGGALLGDRLRMPSRPTDEGLFIRSVAASGGHQAVAENVDLMIRLLVGFGFGVILLETVGAGQGDTAVSGLADVVVLLVQPESGDSIQWEKAGLAEVADVIVVHKADLPGSDALAAQLVDQLSLDGGRSTALVKVSSAKGQGLDELWQAIAAVPLRDSTAGSGQQLLAQAQLELAERFRRRPEAVRSVVERWQRHEIDETQAAQELLRQLL